ncbi:MAG: HAMP domain-containing protein, partial [Candidatus Electrothrix sp. ATG2]|nr:HAMP domain-containing protein [Candidatus Electrothrix sp. ATG2]
MKQINLTGKLSLLVTSGIILSVGTLGVHFNWFLKNNFLENANKRMLYGFQQLASDLATVSQELQEGISFVQTDELFLASMDLINNYQDKNNYNAILLDEEKKTIARQLLSRVKLSLNHHIVLYDKNEELVAFVEEKNGLYHQYFVSYEEGKHILYSRSDPENEGVESADYVKTPFKDLPEDFHHQSYYAYASAQEGALTHHIRNGQILVTSHLSIFDDSNEQILMHIEMSHLFNDKYFKNLSEDLNLIIRYSTNRKNTSNAHLLSEIDEIKKLHLIPGERAYFSTARMTTFDGEFFYHVALNKENLLLTQAKNRRQFLILIVIVVILVLVLLRLVFSRTLIAPLELLMEQIRKIEKQDYSQSALVGTHDELEAISCNINQLAIAVREREDALLESQKTLEYLSHHDPLTDLPNRRLFISRLKQATQQGKDQDTRLAVCFLD